MTSPKSKLPSSAEEPGRLAGVLGLYVSGDVGDTTFYTTRKGRVVQYPKSPPKKPPSPAQLRQRSRFRVAQLAYMQLPDAEKQLWEDVTKALSIDATGQNAWLSLALKPDDAWLRIVHQTLNINLPPPPPVPQ
jgi:hypothetical protein